MGSRPLVKISANASRTSLAANSNLRPLFDVRPQAEGFGLSNESATWCLADGMNVGETVTLKIYAGKFWNKTSVRLVAGRRHFMISSGHWVDFFICHDPDGNPSNSW